MKDLKITRIELEEVKQRDMSELEIWGAMLMIKEAVNSTGDICDMSIEDVDRDTFYCNKQLEICDGYICTDSDGNLITLHCVFCIENREMLFGYACEYDDENEEDMFLVRID